MHNLFINRTSWKFYSGKLKQLASQSKIAEMASQRKIAKILQAKLYNSFPVGELKRKGKHHKSHFFSLFSRFIYWYYSTPSLWLPSPFYKHFFCPYPSSWPAPNQFFCRYFSHPSLILPLFNHETWLLGLFVLFRLS